MDPYTYDRLFNLLTEAKRELERAALRVKG